MAAGSQCLESARKQELCEMRHAFTKVGEKSPDRKSLRGCAGAGERIHRKGSKSKNSRRCLERRSKSQIKETSKR